MHCTVGRIILFFYKEEKEEYEDFNRAQGWYGNPS